MRCLIRACIVLFLASAALPMTGCVNELTTDMVRAEAYSAFRSGDMPRARELFEQAAGRDATDVKSHYFLGRIGLEQLNDAGYARRHLETCYEIVHAKTSRHVAPLPGTANTAVPFPTITQIADALAESIHRQNNPPQLMGFLQEMIENHGSSRDYIRKGDYLVKLGDPDAAHTSYVAACKVRDPKDAGPYVVLAGFYDSIGDKDQAILALRNAYHIDPYNQDAAAQLRAHGMVPGPSIGLPPQ
jgi:tetratricopeptide (TPR) repeat protein